MFVPRQRGGHPSASRLPCSACSYDSVVRHIMCVYVCVCVCVLSDALVLSVYPLCVFARACVYMCACVYVLLFGLHLRFSHHGHEQASVLRGLPVAYQHRISIG